jgi:hypothetical protein
MNTSRLCHYRYFASTTAVIEVHFMGFTWTAAHRRDSRPTRRDLKPHRSHG